MFLEMKICVFFYWLAVSGISDKIGQDFIFCIWRIWSAGLKDYISLFGVCILNLITTS